MGLNRQGRPPAALILIGNTAALLNDSQDLAEETSREIFMQFIILRKNLGRTGFSPILTGRGDAHGSQEEPWQRTRGANHISSHDLGTKMKGGDIP